MKTLITALAIAAASLSAACTDLKQPPVATRPSAADSAEQVLVGVRTMLTSKGIQRGELMADTAYIYDDQTRFDLRKVRVNFNTETGAPQGTMRADRGIYSTRSEIVEAFGNAVVTFVDGRSLKSPHLIYKRNVNDISSDTTFEISGPKGTYSGVGVSFDPGFTRFTCQRNCGGSSAVVLPNR
jgi:LPS export ABC transporter protein LptC